MSGGRESLERGRLNEEARLAGCSIVGFFPSFYDLFIFTDHLAHRAVVMMSAGIDLRGWQQTFTLTAVTKKK